MVLSGLWENDIFTKAYLPQIAPMCPTDTGAKKERKLAPLGAHFYIHNIMDRNRMRHLHLHAPD